MLLARRQSRWKPRTSLLLFFSSARKFTHKKNVVSKMATLDCVRIFSLSSRIFTLPHSLVYIKLGCALRIHGTIDKKYHCNSHYTQYTAVQPLSIYHLRLSYIQQFYVLFTFFDFIFRQTFILLLPVSFCLCLLYFSFHRMHIWNWSSQLCDIPWI